MVDGTRNQPTDAHLFQAPQSGDLSLPRHDLVLPDTVPQTALDIWGPNAIRIHHVEGGGENARGFLAVTSELVAWTRSIPAITGFARGDREGVGVGALAPDVHFTGHFGGGLRQFKVLPGHYSERASVVTAGLTAANAERLEDFTEEVVPVSITTVDFKGVVGVGDTPIYIAKMLGSDSGGFYANIIGKSKGADIIEMKGVQFVIQPRDEDVLPVDEIDEAAIQAIAIIGLGSTGLELDEYGNPTKVGVFKRIAGAEYHQPARVGDELQVVPKGLAMKSLGGGTVLMAGADVLNQRGELVVSYKRTAAGLIGFQEAAALFQRKAA